MYRCYIPIFSFSLLESTAGAASVKIELNFQHIERTFFRSPVHLHPI